MAMVWDREIKAIAEALTVWDKKRNVIILSDLEAAIAVIKKAGKTGKARTGELRKVMRKIEEGKKTLGPNVVSLE